MSLKRSIVYIAIFIIGFIAVSIWNFYTLTHPSKIKIERTPEEVGLSVEDVSLTTEDGITLAGWHIPSEDSPDQVLLLLHGYPVEKADLLGLASNLYPEFSLLLIDFRYFGESGGRATTLGIQEPLDVMAAISFLKERGYEHVGVFGLSLGGATALRAAADDTRIDAVASYGSFADMRMLGREVYRSLSLLKYPMVELMNIWARLSYGTWAHDVSPAQAAMRIEGPVFIGHAENDTLISVHHAQKIIDRLNEAGNPPEVYITSGARHIGLPQDIDTRLRAFFNTHFPG